MLLKAFPLAESRFHGGLSQPLWYVYLPIVVRLFTIMVLVYIRTKMYYKNICTKIDRFSHG